MSTVIELLGGPGCGKSTLAANIFVYLKQAGLSAELVPEHVKYWAWDNHPIGTFEQPYLVGHQIRAESRLYGKVNYIISDSPVIMYPAYEELYQKVQIIRPAVTAFLQESQKIGIQRYTFKLPRVVNYDLKGRYEDPEMASVVDSRIEEFCAEQNYPYTVLNEDPKLWLDEILDALDLL